MYRKIEFNRKRTGCFQVIYRKKEKFVHDIPLMYKILCFFDLFQE